VHDKLFGSALLFEKVLHSGVEDRNLFEKLFYNLKEMVGVAVAANRQEKEFLRRFVRWKCYCTKWYCRRQFFLCSTQSFPRFMSEIFSSRSGFLKGLSREIELNLSVR
jgi:hypothetical protein